MTLHELIRPELEVKILAESLSPLLVGHTTSIGHEEERNGPLEPTVNVGEELQRPPRLREDMVALLQDAVDVERESERRRDGEGIGAGLRVSSRSTAPELG